MTITTSSGAVPQSAAAALTASLPDVAAPGLAALTRLPDKLRWYAMDSYFRIAWSELDHAWGSAAVTRLHTTASLYLRPEALAGSGADRAVDAARRLGFTPVAWAAVPTDRRVALELWRYQNNAGSVDRLLLSELIFAGRPSAFVLLRDDAPEAPLPAATRMSIIKGPSNPAHQHADSIRQACAARYRMLPMVHSADEPADVVRELGVLLDPGERARVRAALELGRDAGDELTAYLRRNAAVPLPDYADAVGRVRGVLQRRGDVAAERELDRSIAHGHLDAAQLVAHRAEFATWDLEVVGSALIRCDDSDDMLICGDPVTAWRAGPREPADPYPAGPAAS